MRQGGSGTLPRGRSHIYVGDLFLDSTGTREASSRESNPVRSRLRSFVSPSSIRRRIVIRRCVAAMMPNSGMTVNTRRALLVLFASKTHYYYCLVVLRIVEQRLLGRSTRLRPRAALYSTVCIVARAVIARQKVYEMCVLPRYIYCKKARKYCR